MSTPKMMHIDSSSISRSETEILQDAVNSLPEDSLIKEMLKNAINATGNGGGFFTISDGTQLSPNEAAGILGMSRPHLLKFIRSGELQATLTGTHHRIAVEDLMEFKVRRDQASKDVAAILSRPRTLVPGLEISDLELAELDDL